MIRFRPHSVDMRKFYRTARRDERIERAAPNPSSWLIRGRLPFITFNFTPDFFSRVYELANFIGSKFMFVIVTIAAQSSVALFSRFSERCLQHHAMQIYTVFNFIALVIRMQGFRPRFLVCRPLDSAPSLS